jgi:hypothetical protein
VLYKELREVVIEIWGDREYIEAVAGCELASYLEQGLPEQAAWEISVFKNVRLTRARLVEPVSRARKCWQKLDLQIDIAKAYCEMQLDEEIGGEVIGMLEEEVQYSSLVKLFKWLELSLNLA